MTIGRCPTSSNYSSISERLCASASARTLVLAWVAILPVCWWLKCTPCLQADEPASIAEAPITDSDRDHWSFAPIVRPPLPQVRDRQWPRNGIDTFILFGLEQATLPPALPAEGSALVRRVYFDLVGRPPTPLEYAIHTRSWSDLEYERLVDRLLASEEFGLRWGQHWLDLARFAQTDGFEHDRVRADAWKYRDWVLQALNDDMPYDRFICLQVAGDLVEDGRHQVATTFCLAGPDMPDVNDQEERRHNRLNELTSAVGSVLLGLQFGCAQCHDHKYDPISQADFYRLRGVFENSVPRLKRDEPCNSLSYQADVEAPRIWLRGDHRRPGPIVEAAFPRIANAAGSAIATDAIRIGRLKFAQWLVDASNPLAARVIVNRLWQSHFGAGIFRDSSDAGVVPSGPSHPELLDWLAAEFRDTGWSMKKLHRLIVLSATYRQTSRSDSLDPAWKRRLEIDPINNLISRFPRKRLEGEAIRDAMLTVSGLVNRQTGGSGVMPPLPDELLDTLLKGQWTSSPNIADHYRRSVFVFARRNLRYPLFDVFDRPDANASCAVRNKSTTALQSLQMINSEFSLDVARHLADQINAAIDDSHPQQWRRGLVELLIRRTYSREAQSDEIDLLEHFLADQASRLQEQTGQVKSTMPDGDKWQPNSFDRAAVLDMCLAAINANEFIYLD